MKTLIMRLYIHLFGDASQRDGIDCLDFTILLEKEEPELYKWLGSAVKPTVGTWLAANNKLRHKVRPEKAHEVREYLSHVQMFINDKYNGVIDPDMPFALFELMNKLKK